MFGQDHYNPLPQDLFFQQQYQAYPNPIFIDHQEQPFSNQNAVLQPQDVQQDIDFDLLLLSSDTSNYFNQLEISEYTDTTPVSTNCQPSAYFNPPCDSIQSTEDHLDQFLIGDLSLLDPTPSIQNQQAYPQQIESDQSKPTDKFILNIETDSAAEPTQVLVTIPAVEVHERKPKTFPKEKNKQKCKKYREKKKQKKTLLYDELKLEMEKNGILKTKAKILQQRVNKFRKIYKKIAMNQKINMSAEILQLIFDS